MLFLVIFFWHIQDFIDAHNKAAFLAGFNAAYLFLMFFPAAALYIYDKTAARKTITLYNGVFMVLKNNVLLKSIHLKDTALFDADYKRIFWTLNGTADSVGILGLQLKDRQEVIMKVKNTALTLTEGIS
jgi:hypothetical protein